MLRRYRVWMVLTVLLLATPNRAGAEGASPPRPAIAYADIGLAFFNRFSGEEGRASTDCFQRYHVATLGLARGKADAEFAYYWRDAVSSATSFHDVTPYTASVGWWASEQSCILIGAALVRDIIADRNMSTLVEASWRHRTPGTIHMEASLGLRYIPAGHGAVPQVVPGASVAIARGQSVLELSLDNLPAIDYSLLGVGRHVASLRASLPAWGGKVLSFGVSRVTSGDVPVIPGRVWVDVRVDFGHLAVAPLALVHH